MLQCDWICDQDVAKGTFKCLDWTDYCNKFPDCKDGTDENWCHAVSTHFVVHVNVLFPGPLVPLF